MTIDRQALAKLIRDCEHLTDADRARIGEIVQEARDRDAERKQAAGRKMLEPFIESLFRQRAAFLRAGRRPAWIEFPRSFPDLFDGGYVIGLPIRRTDVTEPTVFSDTPLSVLVDIPESL